MITEVVERGCRAEDEKSEVTIFINENLTQKPQEVLATAIKFGQYIVNGQ